MNSSSRSIHRACRAHVMTALCCWLALAGCGKERDGTTGLPATGPSGAGGSAVTAGAGGVMDGAGASTGAGGGGTQAVPIAGSGDMGAGPAGQGGAGGDATSTTDAGAMQPVADAAAGDDGSIAAPDAMMPPREDLGEGDGRDVITIGDSWMSNTLLTGGAIEGALSRLTGQPYRNYAVQGVLLLQSSLFGAAIPTQYDRAKAVDPDVVTVIMTGGGNDIIQNPSVQSSCASGGDACKQKLAEIVAALDALWTKMADDGVKDVVFIRYSSDAGSTDESLRGGGDPPAICLTGRIRCHSIDTTDAVMMQLQDGIHPTRAANDRIAKKVVDYMVANGIRR